MTTIEYRSIIILTKSSKHSGYCVAGIDSETGQFLRIVSSRPEKHLFANDMKYKDNSIAQILDIAKVPIINSVPSRHQQENVLVNSDIIWEKLDKSTLCNIQEKHPPEKHQNIFGNTYSYITKPKVIKLNYSLILIIVKDLTLVKSTNNKGEHKIKATFIYNEVENKNISVTDPEYYNIASDMKFLEAILIISLPENPYNDKYYKFIAKIFPLKKK